MAQQTTLTKTLVASSSLALGLFSSAATTLYTSGSSAQVGTSTGAVATQLDTARRIAIWSTAADMSGLLVTLSGLSSGNDSVVETIIGATASGVVRETKQDFATVTSVAFSSQNPIAAALHIATSSHGGTPWIVADTWRNPFNLAAQITLSATGNSLSANFEYTLEDITQATIPGPTKVVSSTPTTVLPWFPTPAISQIAGSTFLSTAIDAVTAGVFTAPIAAWRVTLTSSSSTAGQMGVSVLQSG
jgi:hypothetical protein